MVFLSFLFDVVVVVFLCLKSGLISCGGWKWNGKAVRIRYFNDYCRKYDFNGTIWKLESKSSWISFLWAVWCYFCICINWFSVFSCFNCPCLIIIIIEIRDIRKGRAETLRILCLVHHRCDRFFRLYYSRPIFYFMLVNMLS